ncbi:MAG: FkbM family methyltransferase [bacterium]|nr:FkbM family methyltransferase [bacterium]
MLDLTPLIVCLRALSPLPGRVRLLAGLLRLAGVSSFGARQGFYRFNYDAEDRYQVAMALGRYEPATLAVLRRALRPGDVYVDVGAQIGAIAAAAAPLVGSRGRMVLFEPDPRAFALLKANLAPVDARARAAAPSVNLFNEACSEAAGRRTLNLAPILGQSNLDGIHPDPAAGYVEVTVCRLDDRLRELGLERIRLLKMDIEGHELWALRGMAEWLEAGRIDCVIVEKNAWALEQLGYTPAHLNSFFAACGYAGAHEDGQPLDRASIAGREWENWIYTRPAELMGTIFPRWDPVGLNGGFTAEDLGRLNEEATTTGHPAIKAGLIIQRAAQGHLAEAIAQARWLIAADPPMFELRGHLAHWLAVSGAIDEARAEYEILLGANPHDEEARRRLAELNARPGAGPGARSLGGGGDV